jgi:parvulin-like peptidyl-prolyl isomerase
VFFEQEVGTYGQPIRGPFGWYLPRLFRRTKPPERVSMDEQTFKELVLDDYLQTELNRFAQELIKKNEVYGLDLYEG